MPRKIKRIDDAPQGLLYVPDFISPADEQRILAEIEQGVEFYDFVLQGVAAKRKIHHFGYGYEFYSEAVHEQDPFPNWLIELRDKAAPFAGLPAEEMEQALVARYAPGAGIGWHRDAPAFGPEVVGISLASDDTMRFRRLKDDVFELYKQPIARRSLYVLRGASRSVWQHSIAPVKQLRYAITFRTVRKKYKKTS